MGVQERLAALVTLLEAVTVRVRTLGLARTAEDLAKVTSELRRLRHEVSQNGLVATGVERCRPERTP
jgi:hypothetical protein